MDFLSSVFHLFFCNIGAFADLTTIGLLVLGCLIGTIFGALPGLTSTMSLALFTPLTFGLSSSQAIIFLIAIYTTAVFGGSISAVLINIPGTPGSIASTFDGYPMAQRGEAGRALGLAIISSALGGLFGMVILVLTAPLVAQVALKFCSWEYALLAIFGLTLIAYVSGESLLKGIIAGVLGLFLATIGQDPITAYPRFAFGTAELLGGIELIPILIGFFGMSEVLVQIDTGFVKNKVTQKISKLFSWIPDLKKVWKVLLRSSVVGTLVGAVPGTGGSIACVASYAIEKQISPNGDKFGTGIPEGIVAAAASNNATVGGALIPMLTLGIPGDPMTAVLIGALLFHGLVPGPLLFEENPDFISAIFLTLSIACIMIAVIGIVGAKPMAKVLQIPYSILLPVIMVLCMIGSYATNLSLFDVGVTVFFGVVGYFLRKVGFPLAPIIVGIILGPLFEDNIRRSLMISGGSFIPFCTRPFCLILIFLILLTVAFPYMRKWFRKRLGI
ncbi:MAG TPA: tripartite tricarboxylate transporter permease [Synergistales bacterium]|nr:tripartite tricarboxylate transporter permease [Synergistales bacterium]